jgi:hypothetical protein
MNGYMIDTKVIDEENKEYDLILLSDDFKSIENIADEIANKLNIDNLEIERIDMIMKIKIKKLKDISDLTSVEVEH